MRLHTCSRAIVLVLLCLPACNQEGEPNSGSTSQPQDGRIVSSVIVDDVGLYLADTVVTPNFRDETAWFQSPRRLLPSDVTGRLWSVDPINAVLAHLDSSGQAHRVFAKHGRGPRELMTPLDLAESGETLIVLDAAAPRIAGFKVDGNLEFEIPFETPVRSFAMLSSDEFAVVPGRDRLVDVYTRDGAVRSLGPRRGDSLSCATCQLAALPDGRLLVAVPEIPRLLVIDGGTGTRRISVDLRNSVMKDWQSTFASDRSHERRAGRAAAFVGKRWIGQIVEASRDEVSLLMYSSRPGIDGNELWQVDLVDGSTIRFRLAGEAVESVVWQGGHLLGLLVGDAAIVRLATGHNSGGGSP